MQTARSLRLERSFLKSNILQDVSSDVNAVSPDSTDTP